MAKRLAVHCRKSRVGTVARQRKELERVYVGAMIHSEQRRGALMKIEVKVYINNIKRINVEFSVILERNLTAATLPRAASPCDEKSRGGFTTRTMDETPSIASIAIISIGGGEAPDAAMRCCFARSIARIDVPSLNSKCV